MDTSEIKEKWVASVFIKGGAFISLALGIMAILGWIFDIAQLASFGYDKIPMALSTAVLFAAYGLIILFYRHIQSSQTSFRIVLALSYFGVFFALLMLFLSLNRIRLSAEHLGINLSGNADELVVGHMSPVTAFCFLLTGLSFLIFLVLKDRKKLNSNVLLLPGALILITIIFLLSYLFGTPLLYGGNIIPPALPTTSAFLFLGIALLFILGLRVWKYEDVADAINTRQTFILALIFIVLFVSIITVGYSYYSSYEKHYRMEIENQLSAIADMKVSELVQWRKERLGDAEVFYKNTEFSGIVTRYMNNPNDSDAKKRIQGWIGQVKSAYNYNRICIHNINGTEVISTSNEQMLKPFIFSVRSSEVLKSGDIVFEDFYRDENDDRIYLTIFIPLLSGTTVKNVVAVLALQIDPEQYLYPLLSEWPTISKTAESLIIRREGNEAVFLNELRFHKNSALNFKSQLTNTNLPAVQAALGRKGIFEGADYRGVQVIAYVCPIPNSPWYLVARMDTSEVYEPLNERLWFLLFFITILLIGTGSTIALVWHNEQVRFHKEKYLAEKKQASLQNIINKSLNEIYVFNSDTLKFNYVNDGAIINLGYSIKELEEMTPLNIKPKFTITSFKEMLTPLFEKKIKVLLFETIHRRKDGSEYDVEVHLQLIDSEMGMVFLAIVNDITERKRTEHALRESKQLLQNIIDNSPSIIFIFDTDGKAQLANRKFESVLNLTNEKMIGNIRHHFMPKEIADQHRNNDLVVIKTKHSFSFEEENLESDGKHFYHTEKFPLTDAEGNVFAVGGISTDITERKKAEETLHESELRFRMLFDKAPLGYQSLDLDGNFIDVNQAWLDTLGYDREEVIGKWFGNFLTPKYQDGFQKRFPIFKAQGKIHSEFEMVHKNGNIRFIGFDGRIGNDLEGNFKQTHCILKDITEQRHAEEEIKKLNNELEQRVAQRTSQLEEVNKELESFSYSVSHDLRAPLRHISGFVSLLTGRFDQSLPPKAKHYLESIADSTHQMGMLIDDLLQFSRTSHQEMQLTNLDMNEVFNDALSQVKHDIKRQSIEWVTTPLPNVFGDKALLCLVWINLLSNAVKFTKKKEKARIEINSSIDGDEIVFSVKDNGVGFDMKYSQKLFGVFQRLHSTETFEGTGIGLANVKRIILKHSGRTWAEAEPDKGATFYFTLPNFKENKS